MRSTRLTCNWRRFGRTISVFFVVLGGCRPAPPSKPLCPKDPASTLNQMLSRADRSSLLLFVSMDRLWVMSSAVARLRQGRLETADKDEGFNELLFKALIQEARNHGRPISRVVIYAVPGIPKETLQAIMATVLLSQLGRIVVLPWELMGEGACRPVVGRAEKPIPETMKETRLDARNPLVIRATGRGIWLNGKLVLRLFAGRLTRGGKGPAPDKVLSSRISALLRKMPMEQWRLLLVVTYDVHDSVIRSILAAAGDCSIAKFRMERVLGH